MKQIRNIGDIAHLYDGFIIDLWGVVHNGVEPYPDAVPAMLDMKKARRKVWLLSNAPRRAHTVKAKLTEMGVPETAYDGIITSGEATWLALQADYLKDWGRRIYHLGPERDSSLYEGLDVEIVDRIADADFILNSGIYELTDGLDLYRSVLEEAAGRSLNMICANPDRIVHVGDHLAFCAGALADMYEKMDDAGEVVYFGKPYRDVYRMCFEGIGSKKVLAIGDGMPTDIAGAAGSGIDGALVTSGIHREHFVPESQLGHDPLFAQYPYKPSYLIDRMVW